MICTCPRHLRDQALRSRQQSMAGALKFCKLCGDVTPTGFTQLRSLYHLGGFGSSVLARRLRAERKRVCLSRCTPLRMPLRRQPREAGPHIRSCGRRSRDREQEPNLVLLRLLFSLFSPLSSRQAADSSSSERLRRHRAEALSWPLWFWKGWGQFVWGLVFRFPILGIVDSQTKTRPPAAT
jgi:hypothetical protein